MKIKHQKIKNSGIIYEMLIRQITSDILNENQAKAIDIIKKYYMNTEIAKEHKLYKMLFSFDNLSEIKSNVLIDTLIKENKKINQIVLKQEKYNLIKEIKKYYELDTFFQHKVDNYKEMAALYNLLEANLSKEFTNPSLIVENKNTLISFLSNTKSNLVETDSELIKEYLELDKGTRFLAYKNLLEKFNDKYSELNIEQKEVLKEYINNISNKNTLREFVNKNYSNISKQLNVLKNNIKDETVLIKINEVLDMIKPLDKTQQIKDNYVVNILQYYTLIDELKKI